MTFISISKGGTAIRHSGVGLLLFFSGLPHFAGPRKFRGFKKKKKIFLMLKFSYFFRNKIFGISSGDFVIVWWQPRFLRIFALPFLGSQKNFCGIFFYSQININPRAPYFPRILGNPMILCFTRLH